MDLHEITNLIYKDYLPERLQWVTSYNLLSYYVMKALCVLYFSKVGLQDIIINRTDYTISPNNIQILPLFDPRNYKFNTSETPYIPSLPDTIHYYDPTNEGNYEVFGSKFEDHRIMIELFRIYFGGLKSSDKNLFNNPFKIPNLIKNFGLKWLDYKFIHNLEIQGGEKTNWEIFTHTDIIYELKEYVDTLPTEEIIQNRSVLSNGFHLDRLRNIEYITSYTPSYLFTIKDLNNKLIKQSVNHYYTNEIKPYTNIFERFPSNNIIESNVHQQFPYNIYNQTESLIGSLPKETKYNLRERCELELEQKASISLFTNKPTLIIIQISTDVDNYKIVNKNNCLYIDYNKEDIDYTIPELEVKNIPHPYN